MKVYDNQTGTLHAEYALAKRGNDRVRFTSHPQGGGRLMVTIVNAKPQDSGPARLFYVELL